MPLSASTGLPAHPVGLGSVYDAHRLFCDSVSKTLMYVQEVIKLAVPQISKSSGGGPSDGWRFGSPLLGEEPRLRWLVLQVCHQGLRCFFFKVASGSGFFRNVVLISRLRLFCVSGTLLCIFSLNSPLGDLSGVCCQKYHFILLLGLFFCVPVN